MIEKLKHLPLFVALLSIFFVIHGVLENFGFISYKDAGILLLTYIGLTIIVWGLLWLLFRNSSSTAIATTSFMFFFFFYEAFMQFVREKFPNHFLTSYGFLLSTCALIMITLFIYLKKSKRTFPRLYLFLNIVLIIYILIDTGWTLFKFLYPSDNPLSVYSMAGEKNIQACSTCKKPNVYFLLFDEYASSLSLQEHFHYNNPLDSFLLKKRFHINKQSNSNYALTVFSMASVLNMAYIGGLKDPGHITSQDYSNAHQLIRNNKVIQQFSSLGYLLKNYSIFDLAGHPTEVWQSFLPLNTRLITERTMTARLDKGITALLVRNFGIKHFVVQDYEHYALSNKKFMELVANEAVRKNNQPAFLYAHFVMPHFPYLYDSLGHRRNDWQVYEERITTPPASYLNYLAYTNKYIEHLVEHIRLNDPEAIILLCGDHGYRYLKDQHSIFPSFQNLNAVYFPDHDYSRWGDKISFVNEFRIVFNQLFHFNYPLLKDSIILLREKK